MISFKSKYPDLDTKYPFLKYINGVFISSEDTLGIPREYLRQHKKVLLPINEDMFEDIMDSLFVDDIVTIEELLDKGIDNLIW